SKIHAPIMKFQSYIAHAVRQVPSYKGPLLLGMCRNRPDIENLTVAVIYAPDQQQRQFFAHVLDPFRNIPRSPKMLVSPLPYRYNKILWIKTMEPYLVM